MKSIVLDASVIIKWIKPQNEDKIAASHQYLIDHSQGNILIHSPSILYYELHNTISRLSKNIRPPKLLIVLKNINIKIIPLSKTIITNAYEFVDNYQISFYDASYISLAYELGCDMITADKTLVKKVRLPYVRLLS